MEHASDESPRFGASSIAAMCRIDLKMLVGRLLLAFRARVAGGLPAGQRFLARMFHKGRSIGDAPGEGTARAAIKPRLASATLVVLSGIALVGALFPDAGAGGAGPVHPASALSRPVEPSVSAVPPAVAIGLRPAASAAGWLPVKRPIAMFNLEGPETDRAEFSYQVSSQGTQARQDVMVWTSKEERKGLMTRPAIRLIVERYENLVATHRPFYSDIALRAAEADMSIERMNPARELLTKFGAMEIADAVLTGDQGALGCLVYRRIDTIGVTIAGWYCGTAARPADQVSLQCFVNRLDLMSAGQDVALKRYFAAAERRRAACPSSRQAGKKLTWLDHEAPLPTLKLSSNQQRQTAGR
jgi:hypothetical protein